MADEKLEQNVNENETKQETQEENNLLNAYLELKQNSVTKEKYDQLRQENKSLIDALKNGQQIEVEEETFKVNPFGLTFLSECTTI